MDTNVIQLRPRSDAPVQAFPQATPEEAPRAEFGRRPPPDIFRMAGGTDRVLDVFNDGRASRTERVLEAVKDALSGKAPPARKADPAERHEAAGMLNAGASGWRDVARYLESIGCIRQARTAYDMADLSETMGAEVLVAVTPDGA